MEELQVDIDIYKTVVEEFKKLDSANIDIAYSLSQQALITADRWNEIMLDSAKYSKELNYNKSEFTSYCYQKFKILMKIHDFCRIVYRQGAYDSNKYGDGIL